MVAMETDALICGRAEICTSSNRCCEFRASYDYVTMGQIRIPDTLLARVALKPA